MPIASAPDLSDVISQINEEMLRDIDTDPGVVVDPVINGGTKVFDNSSVFEKLDKLRNEITAETISTGKGYGLQGKTENKVYNNVEVITEPPKTTTNPYNTTTSTTGASTNSSPYSPYNPYNPYRTQQTTTQQTVKTREEKVAEYTDKVLETVTKQVVGLVEKEQAKITQKKSNWTIFDMHEEKMTKEMNMTDRQLERSRKKPLISDKTKISLLDSVVLTGKTALTLLLVGNKKGDK